MKNYVWYACYGSNINNDRFNYYIRGGTYAINESYYHGCRDKTNYVAKTTMNINHRLYFAKESSSWENKAVAFITSESNDDYRTKCVLYKVTTQQFIDIFLQENSKDPEKHSSVLSSDELLNINVGNQKNIGKDNENTWYGRLIRFDNYEGVPVFSFTSKQDYNTTVTKEPGGKYLEVIGNGLIENYQLTEAMASQYIYYQDGVFNSSWTKDKISMLFQEKFEVIGTGFRNATKGQFIAQFTKNDLEKNQLIAGKSDVIISHNIKGSKHVYKIPARVKEYPYQNQKGLDGIIALDQTIRDAIGCDKEHEKLNKEDYTVAIVPHKFSRIDYIKKNTLSFERQLNMVRVFKATPNDMEINICRLDVATLQSIGIDDGDKIKVKSATKEIHIRALAMNKDDIKYRESVEYLNNDGGYEKLIALRKEKNTRKVKISEKEKIHELNEEGKIENIQATEFKPESLAMIFLDNDARLKLDIMPGDPVIIYRSNWFAIQKNIHLISIPLLLAFLSIGLKLDVLFLIAEENVLPATLLFYLASSIVIILINLEPIRNKFK